MGHGVSRTPLVLCLFSELIKSASHGSSTTVVTQSESIHSRHHHPIVGHHRFRREDKIRKRTAPSQWRVDKTRPSCFYSDLTPASSSVQCKSSSQYSWHRPRFVPDQKKIQTIVIKPGENKGDLSRSSQNYEIDYLGKTPCNEHTRKLQGDNSVAQNKGEITTFKQEENSKTNTTVKRTEIPNKGVKSDLKSTESNEAHPVMKSISSDTSDYSYSETCKPGRAKVSTVGTAVGKKLKSVAGKGKQMSCMSDNLHERIAHTQREIAALKHQISKRSKSLSPVKMPKLSVSRTKVSQPQEVKNLKMTSASSQCNVPSGDLLETDTNERKTTGSLMSVSRYKLKRSSNSLPEKGGNEQMMDLQKQSTTLPAMSYCNPVEWKDVTAGDSNILFKPGPGHLTPDFSGIISKRFSGKHDATKASPKYIKRTKYSIVKVCREPSSTSTSCSDEVAHTSVDSKNKTPNSAVVAAKALPKFVSSSRYSLKRVRRSLSDENKVVTRGFVLAQSPLQLAAKTVRSKYKMQKVGTLKRHIDYCNWPSGGAPTWSSRRYWRQYAAVRDRRAYIMPFWQRHRGGGKVTKPNHFGRKKGKKKIQT